MKRIEEDGGRGRLLQGFPLYPPLPGLLEACYHNALYYQLTADGLSVHADVPFEVTHLGYMVGQYYADLVAAVCQGKVKGG